MFKIEEIIRDYYLNPTLDNFITLFEVKFKNVSKKLPLEFEFDNEKFIVFLNQSKLVNHINYKDFGNVIVITDDSKNSNIQIFKNKKEVYSIVYPI